jgi:hypothetical protein
MFAGANERKSAKEIQIDQYVVLFLYWFSTKENQMKIFILTGLSFLALSAMADQLPYFEQSVGGEMFATSPATAEESASQKCSSDIVSLSEACESLQGRFQIDANCNYLYTREHCPERCGTFGSAYVGAVSCHRPLTQTN